MHLIAAIEQHRADERKHYLMFRRWFELRGVMPFAVDRTCGHIDRFVEIMFRQTIDELDTSEVIARDELFERLCRVIALTERRGYRQVDILLRHPIVRTDKVLMKIFRIIEKDEPSHWAPYEGWLSATWPPRSEMVGARDRRLHPFGAAVPETAAAVPEPEPAPPHRLGDDSRESADQAARGASPARM